LARYASVGAAAMAAAITRTISSGIIMLEVRSFPAAAAQL
jgi:hypothetical protein